ncbi:MAG: TRAP transporter large permease subunit [Bilophila wadsworthia]
MELVVFLVSLFGFLALGIPIAIVLVLCSMVLMYYGGMWDSMFVMIIPQSMLDGANNYPLMAIPFFVFAGEIMTEGGLSKRVVKLAQLIIGRVRGGLGYAAIVSSVIFAGLMGSSVGEAAASRQPAPALDGPGLGISPAARAASSPRRHPRPHHPRAPTLSCSARPWALHHQAVHDRSGPRPDHRPLPDGHMVLYRPH